MLRKKKNGLTSLFINRKQVLPFGEWLDAECHPTKGYKVRPYWHCLSRPEAPHLTQRGRVWVKVQIEKFLIFRRPESQGGEWLLAQRIKLLETI